MNFGEITGNHYGFCAWQEFHVREVKHILEDVIKYAKLNSSLRNISEIHRISVRTSQNTACTLQRSNWRTLFFKITSKYMKMRCGAWTSLFCYSRKQKRYIYVRMLRIWQLYTVTSPRLA